MNLTQNQILDFLIKVDKSFPVPLSEKTNLKDLAKKFYEKATICYEADGEEILSLVAGYTDNVTDGLAYASVLATVEFARGRGLARKCLSEFLDIATEKKLRGVHLYTARENLKAIDMYLKEGFVPFVTENESRPDDLHLIYLFEDNL